MDFSEIFAAGDNGNLEKKNLRMKIVAEVEGGKWLAVDAAGEALLQPAPEVILKGQFKAGKFIKIIGELRKISANTLEISSKAIICPIRYNVCLAICQLKCVICNCCGETKYQLCNVHVL
jgi:hypothetical protein